MLIAGQSGWAGQAQQLFESAPERSAGFDADEQQFGRMDHFEGVPFMGFSHVGTP
jgi:hypothetical protein